jgi:hypothetical protein
VTDPQRDRIAASFERELARAPLPPGLRAEAVRYALHATGADQRQRPPRALAVVAALLAVAIVATLVFVAHQSHAVPVQPEPHRATPYTIPSPPSAAAGCNSVPRQWASSPAHPAKMLSTTTGWAYGPMRTTDGGANWLDVSPPSIPGRTVKNDEFFLDATHAWVAETAATAGKCVDHVVTFRTADGGQTWQQASPIPVRFAGSTDVIWTGATNHASWLYFVDPQNGWLLLGSGPASFKQSDGVDQSWIGAGWSVGDLYRTNDGGLHWTLAASSPGSSAGCIPAPLNGRLHESAISFSSPTTGWMVATCGSTSPLQLLVTYDGGRSWAKSATPLAPNEAPVFFDQRHGLMFGDGGLLATSDGGATWSVRTTQGAFGAIDFINPSQGWAIGPGDTFLQCSPSNLVPCSGNFRFYHTDDGGKTWVRGSTTSLQVPATKWWPPSYLHFVDSKNGFLDPGDVGFFRTTDRGHTWTAVNGTVEGPGS